MKNLNNYFFLFGLVCYAICDENKSARVSVVKRDINEVTKVYDKNCAQILENNKNNFRGKRQQGHNFLGEYDFDYSYTEDDEEYYTEIDYPAEGVLVPYLGWMTHKGYERTCSATLLYPSWAITTASCITGWNENSTIVRFGVNHSNEERTVTRRVSEFFRHPNYDSAHNYSNDLALVRFQKPLKYSKGIYPVKLTHSLWKERTPLECKAAGFDAFNISLLYNATAVRGYGDKLCECLQGDKFICITEYIADKKCILDGGGPLITFRNSTPYIIGVRHGRFDKYKCEEELEAIYFNSQMSKEARESTAGQQQYKTTAKTETQSTEFQQFSSTPTSKVVSQSTAGQQQYNTTAKTETQSTEFEHESARQDDFTKHATLVELKTNSITTVLGSTKFDKKTTVVGTPGKTTSTTSSLGSSRSRTTIVPKKRRKCINHNFLIVYTYLNNYLTFVDEVIKKYPIDKEVYVDEDDTATPWRTDYIDSHDVNPSDKENSGSLAPKSTYSFDFHDINPGDKENSGSLTPKSTSSIDSHDVNPGDKENSGSHAPKSTYSIDSHDVNPGDKENSGSLTPKSTYNFDTLDVKRNDKVEYAKEDIRAIYSLDSKTIRLFGGSARNCHSSQNLIISLIIIYSVLNYL
ncbi:hypothetical protein O3M35_012835 [Rhynocoris fuscipes]|uniref:Peptidase S1 domain-containing protein n=1 Tax=Rhynocoris fuscipes TaxID=488301 RepID=A0AAW1CFJ4_9HEMI